MQDRRNMKRTRSRSPINRGFAIKARSTSRSASLKRRRGSLPEDQKNARRTEGPCKREADSTNMSQKFGGRATSPRRRAALTTDDHRGVESKTHKFSHSGRFRSDKDDSKLRERRPSAETGLKPREKTNRRHDDKSVGSEKLKDDALEHSKHSSKHSSKHDTKRQAEEKVQVRTDDQTKLTMDERFSALTGAPKSFSLDENVSIEIERSIEGRSVPFEIPMFFSEAVVINRRPDEGKKPLSDREEFRQRREDKDEERRTVTVKTNMATGRHLESHRDERNSDGRKADRRHQDESNRSHGRSHNTRPGRLEDEISVLRDARDLLISMRSRDDEGGHRRFVFLIYAPELINNL
jgi:hypothetical protein